MDEYANTKEYRTDLQNTGTKTQRLREDDIGNESGRPSNARVEPFKQELEIEDSPNVLVTDHSAAITDGQHSKHHVTKTNN